LAATFAAHHFRQSGCATEPGSEYRVRIGVPESEPAVEYQTVGISVALAQLIGREQTMPEIAGANAVRTSSAVLQPHCLLNVQ
jgi:hypothetical protein